MTDHFDDQNCTVQADPHEQMLLARIEGLKGELRRMLALLMDDPETPEFFKNDPLMKAVVK